MLKNQFTLVRNFNLMLRESKTSTNNYLIKQLPNAAAFVNKKFEVIHASDKWINDFDFGKLDVFGKTIFELFDDVSKTWQKDLNNSLNGKPCQSGVENYIDNQKNERWFEWVNVPWYDDKENIIGVIIQTEDVTNRIFDDIKLEKLEILLKDKSEISKIGSWEYDAVKDQLSWCAITKSIHEVPTDYIPNIDTGINFYKEGYSRNTIAMAVDNAMRTGMPWNEKLQLVTAKGKEKWVLAAGRPVFTNDKFIGLIGTFQDITDQVITKTKSEEQERIFRSIFNSSYQFTGILDTEGTFLEINDTALKFANLKPEDVINKKFWDAYWWPVPDYLKDGLKEVVKAASEGEFMRSEIVVLDKDKKPVPVDFSLKPIYDENNKIISLLAEGRMIKEMVVAREKLKENEQKFRALYELSPVGYILSDFETGMILDFNTSFANATGYEQKDLGSLNYSDIVSNSSKDNNNTILQELETNGAYTSKEIKYTKLDGTTYPVLASGSLLVNKKGQKLVWNTALDISEIKTKEKQIKEERKLLKTLIDNLPINVYVKDLESRKILVNKSECDYLGIKNQDELLGKNDFDLYDKEIAQTTRDEDIEIMNSLKPVLAKEIISVKKDGTETAFLISKIPLKGADGKAYGMVGISIDISDTKKKEKLIREERKLLKTLIDNLPLNVFVKDRDSRKILVNKSELDFCGVKDEKDLIGKTDFDFFDDETAKSTREEDLRVMETLTPVMGKESINIKKDGTLTTFLTSKIPLKGDNGLVSGLIGISMDISDLKQKEEELRDLINVTSLQNKKLINFAHIVSHNLRSHTANFSMLLDFLVTEKDEVEKNKIVKMLTNASDNLLETLDNLNEVVAISTNINIDKEPIKINDKITTVEQNLSAFLKNNNAKIINKISHDIHVMAIPAYMESILMNFITNSVKYKSPDRDPIIKLTTKKNKNHTILSIEDNGMGIDLKKYGDKLFGMYKTFHDNPDSRGIGLYITKNQVEAMNGKIITCSEVGKGTTFNIYFNEKN